MEIHQGSKSVAEEMMATADAIRKRIKNSPAAAAPVQALAKGFCGAFRLGGSVAWGAKSDAEIRSTVVGWYPAAKAVYKTVGRVPGAEFIVHTLFQQESDLLAAMAVPQPVVGRLTRCTGLSNCAHAECDIKELVVVEFSFGSRQSIPLASDSDQEAKRKLAKEIQSAVEKLASRPLVDDAYLKIAHAIQKSTVFAYLVLHSVSDVKKLVDAEKELKGAVRNAAAVAVDVPNDPALRLCSKCKERGHNDSLCSRIYGGPFAVKALFIDPVSELGRQQIETDHKEWGTVHSIFTGLRIGVKQPRRLVWLTYETQEQAAAGYERLYAKYHPLLTDAFLGVFPDRAEAKCEECGSRHTNGSCIKSRSKPTLYSDVARPAGQSQLGVRPQQLGDGSRLAARRGSTREFGRGGAPMDVCWQYWNTAKCKFGDQCKFRHARPVSDVKDAKSASSPGLGLDGKDALGLGGKDATSPRSPPAAAAPQKASVANRFAGLVGLDDGDGESKDSESKEEHGKADKQSGKDAKKSEPGRGKLQDRFLGERKAPAALDTQDDAVRRGFSISGEREDSASPRLSAKSISAAAADSAALPGAIAPSPSLASPLGGSSSSSSDTRVQVDLIDGNSNHPPALPRALTATAAVSAGKSGAAAPLSRTAREAGSVDDSDSQKSSQEMIGSTQPEPTQPEPSDLAARRSSAVSPVPHPPRIADKPAAVPRNTRSQSRSRPKTESGSPPSVSKSARERERKAGTTASGKAKANEKHTGGSAAASNASV